MQGVTETVTPNKTCAQNGDVIKEMAKHHHLRRRAKIEQREIRGEYNPKGYPHRYSHVIAKISRVKEHEKT